MERSSTTGMAKCVMCGAVDSPFYWISTRGYYCPNCFEALLGGDCLKRFELALLKHFRLWHGYIMFRVYLYAYRKWPRWLWPKPKDWLREILFVVTGIWRS